MLRAIISAIVIVAMLSACALNGPQKPLTVQSPDSAVEGASEVRFLETESVTFPTNPLFVQAGECEGWSWSVVGLLLDGEVGFIKCEESRYIADPSMPEIDQTTLKPIISSAVPTRSILNMPSQLYIYESTVVQEPLTPTSDESEFRKLKQCRLKEAEYRVRPHMASGFPIPKYRARLDEKLIVQVIPVDFKGLRTTSSPIDDLSDAALAIERFWERQSSKPVNMEFRIPSSYIELPKSVKGYDLGSKFPNFDGKKYSDYVMAATVAADPIVDFSGADVVVLAHTPLAISSDVGTFIAEAGMPGSGFAFATEEGTVLNVLIQGADSPRDLQNWIHEFGHMLGLTDSGGVGEMGFDIMLNYNNPELTVWNRFLLGILNESQIACITSETTSTHWIRPVATSENVLKGAVIPLSSTRAIVVESRRRVGFDALLGLESEGLLVYEVDTEKSGDVEDGPFKILGPDRYTVNQGWRASVDAPLKPGESISHKGWKISNLESGAFGDVVKIEAVG
jgi:M6 family metalloprotease-like protein